MACGAAGSDDAVMRQAWEEIVAPAAERFRPDIILVGLQHIIFCETGGNQPQSLIMSFGAL